MKSAAIFALLGCAAAVNLNSCIESGVDGAGLTCVPGNSQLFATGMNGDEDLGEDIIMKGKPFHYNQKLAQGKEAPEEGSAAEEKAEAKEDSKMAEAEAKATKAKTKNVEPAEKVSVLESAIAKEHTTFYDKQAPKQGEFVQLNGDGVKVTKMYPPRPRKLAFSMSDRTLFQTLTEPLSASQIPTDLLTTFRSK